MKNLICINGIEIEVQRKRIKRMHLHVTPVGSVYVSAPQRMPQSMILQFVRDNIGWIEAQKKRFEARPDKEWYEGHKAEFEEAVARLLPKWEERTQLFADSWHSRYMTSRWGSCIPSKKRLCFNLQLFDKPEICLEYVILHELLHLRHPGHGAEFKADLDRYMPDWRQVVRQLK